MAKIRMLVAAIAIEGSDDKYVFLYDEDTPRSLLHSLLRRLARDVELESCDTGAYRAMRRQMRDVSGT